MKKILSLSNGTLFVIAIALYLAFSSIRSCGDSKVQYSKNYQPLIATEAEPFTRTFFSLPEDSAIMAQTLIRRWELETNLGQSYSGMYLDNIGVVSYCDTCYTHINVSGFNRYTSHHYLQLGNYYIARDRYFSRAGSTGYFTNREGGGRKDVSFRYAHSKNSILIPVSPLLYDILEVVLISIMVLTGFFMLVVLTRLPFDVVVNIAKGKPFLKQNVFNLHIIGFALLALPLAGFMMGLILHLVFLHRITDDVVFNWQGLLSRQWGMLLAGLVVLALARAFKRGARLQKESDLTI